MEESSICGYSIGWRKEMKKNGIVGAIIGFSTLSIVIAAIGFIVVPISTRLISTEDLGKINMLQGVVNILVPLMCLGLDHGYIRKYSELDNNTNKRLFSSSLLIALLATVFLGALSTIVWRPISRSIVGDERMDIIVILAISTASYVIERFLEMQCRMENDSKQYGIIAIHFTIANKVIYVLAACFLHNYISLLYVLAISELIASILFLIANRHRFDKKFVEAYQIKDSMSFGIPLMGALVILHIMQYIPKYYLSKSFGYSVVGIYSTAVTLSSVITLIQTGFSLVWAPYVYEHYKEKNNDIDQLQEALVSVLLIFSTLVVFTQYIWVYIVGIKYRSFIIYMPILLMVPVFNSLGDITGIGINIAKKTKLHLVNNTSAILTTFVMSSLLVPAFGPIGAAVASALGSLTLYLLRTLESKKYYMPVKSFKLILFCIGILITASIVNILLINHIVLLHMVYVLIFIIEIFVLIDPIKRVFIYLRKGKLDE